ncbi:hypothetical protein ACHAWO_012655 [Cyclotella atomus]|uniref:Uncharacterized protein n=1 Tax=Cyclotella atomus TaxID=382360 RepID=A0ABD3PMZ3_9STRA
MVNGDEGMPIANAVSEESDETNNDDDEIDVRIEQTTQWAKTRQRHLSAVQPSIQSNSHSDCIYIHMAGPHRIGNIYRCTMRWVRLRIQMCLGLMPCTGSIILQK